MKKRFLTGFLSVVLCGSMLLPSPAFAVLNTREAKVEAAREEGISADSGRQSLNFNKDWRFQLGDVKGAGEKEFDDSGWRKLNLPHDYSIENDFDPDSQAKAGGGFLDGGTAWYRKTWIVPADMAGKRIRVEFEGVYMDSSVYVNGVMVGNYPYGYSAFSYDITDYLTVDGVTENVIAVRVNNEQPSSRWYSGSGIYRDVKLIATDPVHVDRYGTKITMPDLETEYKNGGAVTVKADTAVVNESGSDAEFTLRHAQLAKAGMIFVSGKVKRDQAKVTAFVEVTAPVGIRPVSLVTPPGVQPVLPSRVKLVYSDGSEEDHDVTWDDIEDTKLTDKAEFTVEGAVTGMAGQKACAYVRVSSGGEKKNVARAVSGSSYPKFEASHTSTYDPLEHINDGIISYDTNPKNGWGNWKSVDEFLEETTLDCELEEELTLDNIWFYFREDGGIYIPEDTLIQYWDGENWIDAENQSRRSGFVSGEAQEITFDAVKTKKLRAKFTRGQQDTSEGKKDCLVLTEAEIYAYPPDKGFDTAELTEVTVNGKELEGFDPQKEDYTVRLPYGSAIPKVGAAAADCGTVFVLPALTNQSAAMIRVTSEKFQDTVRYSLPEYYEAGSGTGELFSGLYMEAYKMIQKKYHIGVLTDGDYYIWMGTEYYIDRIKGKRPNFYQDYKMDGTPVIKYAAQNEYLRASMGDRPISEKDRPVVTLSRSFGKDNLMYHGSDILEVQIDAKEFANDILKLSSSKEGTGIKIHILNSRGDTIFSESGRDGRNILEENGWEEGTFQKNGHYIYTYRIFNSELYVLYTISLFDFYREIFGFLGITAVVFCVILLIMVLVSWHMSLELSKPILSLCREMEDVDPDKGRRFQIKETNIRELDFLSRSIQELDRRLEDSTHRMVALKEYESQARMMALQAQMQPHFLVNTLTTMGMMADQGGCREVSSMCLNLTQMFRYIAKEESGGVKLYEEIKHINRYVDIMRERFPGAGAEIDIPLEMMDIRIPKLVIQPLVENSFKYCNRSSPRILVRGIWPGEGTWSVKVSDNGEGFSEEKTEEILEKCREGMEGINSLGAEIDGMGLVNVYVRLHLFYGEDVIYKIERDGIEIGGKSHGESGREEDNGDCSGG